MLLSMVCWYMQANGISLCFIRYHCVVYTVQSCNSGKKMHLMLHEIPVLLMLDVKLHVSFLITHDLWYVLARVLLHVPE